MEHTAMQEAIKEISNLWSSPSDQPNYTKIFNILESKLEMEKQQIIDAYWDGGQDIPLTENICEQYYKNIFKK